MDAIYSLTGKRFLSARHGRRLHVRRTRFMFSRDACLRHLLSRLFIDCTQNSLSHVLIVAVRHG